MVGFTSRKIERAKLVRKIYINVGLPIVKNFKDMVSTNMISNCPISVAYIINSDKIYGPSMASLKVKSTRSKPRTAIKDDIQIPSETHKKQFKHWVMHWSSIYHHWQTSEIQINYSHHISEWRIIFQMYWQNTSKV